MTLSELCFAVSDGQTQQYERLVTQKRMKSHWRDIYLDGRHLRIGKFVNVTVDKAGYVCDVKTGQLYKNGVCMTSERLTCV